MNNLKIGEVYKNSQVARTFGVSTQGGMRKSNKNNCLILISKETDDNLYPDVWNGDTLLYTGTGREGDQDIEKWQNKTLADSRTNGIKVYLFIFIGRDAYKYYGEVELIHSPYIDSDGKRKIIVFPIRPVNLDKDEVKRTQFTSMREKVIRNMSDQQLIASVRRYQAIGPVKAKRTITTTAYSRNKSIVQLAKIYAHGICQLCGKPAPFIDKDGNPYLEVHHIHWLSNGGSDILENVIAICPNCHRKMHQSKNPEEDVKILKKKAKKQAASFNL